MEVQYFQILLDKVLDSASRPPPVLTRRDALVPDLPGKAMTVIGMRRAGKTSFLHQQRSELLARGVRPDRLVYVNFEDERLEGMTGADLGALQAAAHRLAPAGSVEPVTYFLDEIQLVPGWERFVRRLLDEGESRVFLSGSSAKLLSREIASSMRGRGWEIPIHPFSFRESLRHHGKDAPGDTGLLGPRGRAVLDVAFARFLEVGGFPEAQALAAHDRRQLVQGYVDVLLLRDVIERHGIANVTALRWMTRRLLANPAGAFSITRFEQDLRSQGVTVGRETLYAILGHLEDAFLLKAIPVATDSEKRRQVNPRKVYPVDPAVGPVFDRSRKQNLGHALEVAVHNELVRRGADVTYVRTRDGFEVDFLARFPDGSQALVQSCASLAEPGTLEREVRALEAATGEHAVDRRLVLTAAHPGPSPAVPRSIEVLPAWAWMLEA